MKVVNIAYAMIKLPQTLLSRGFTRRTVKCTKCANVEEKENKSLKIKRDNLTSPARETLNLIVPHYKNLMSWFSS